MIAKCKKCGGNPDVFADDNGIYGARCKCCYKIFTAEEWNKLNALNPVSDVAEKADHTVETNEKVCYRCQGVDDGLHRCVPAPFTSKEDLRDAIDRIKVTAENAINEKVFETGDLSEDGDIDLKLLQDVMNAVRIKSVNAWRKHGPFDSVDDMRNKLYEEVVEFEIACRMGDAKEIRSEAYDILTVIARWLAQKEK